MTDHLDYLRAAISARLERVRGNMSEAQFSQLVSEVTRTAILFQDIEARTMGRARPADVTDMALPRLTESESRAM